jgi:hypothetical protein
MSPRVPGVPVHMRHLDTPERAIDALRFYAAAFDDVERLRIANGNRVAAMVRDRADSDGKVRGLGLPAGHENVERMRDVVDTLVYLEGQIGKEMIAALKAHPLTRWAVQQKGIGLKQFARLLAAIGDPYLRPAMLDENGEEISPAGPRTVSALWAYCGLHVIAQEDEATGITVGKAARRRRGVRANWSTNAKMRTHLVAESCMKQLKAPCGVPAGADGDKAGMYAVHVDYCVCSPWRVLYDKRKAYTLDNRPEWTDAHRHTDALRIVGKEILKALWRAARDLHAPELAGDVGPTPRWMQQEGQP